MNMKLASDFFSSTFPSVVSGSLTVTMTSVSRMVVIAIKKNSMINTISGSDEVLMAFTFFSPVFTNLAITLFSYPFWFSFRDWHLIEVINSSPAVFVQFIVWHSELLP